MNGWGRVGGVLLAVGLTAALSGCGQLFTAAQGSPTLTQLSSRVDSIDAQVGEIQAAVANMGGGTPASGTAQSGVVQSNLPIAVVVADVLNVRGDPSLTGTVKGTLLQNARVNVLGEDGNWSEISYKNPNTQQSLTGWVDSDYLGQPQDAATAPAAAAPSDSSTSATPATAGASGTAASDALGGAY